MNYEEWITDYVKKHDGVVAGLCATATNRMCEDFPELKRVAGFAVMASGGSHEHFWCVSPDGSIVDPTVSQWMLQPAEYKEFEPGMEVRVGRCMNCGDGIYKTVHSLSDASYSSCVCSPECADELAEYMNEATNRE